MRIYEVEPPEHCSRCKGTKKVPCEACDGKGYDGTSAKCRLCDNGKKDCVCVLQTQHNLDMLTRSLPKITLNNK